MTDEKHKIRGNRRSAESFSFMVRGRKVDVARLLDLLESDSAKVEVRFSGKAVFVDEGENVMASVSVKMVPR